MFGVYKELQKMKDKFADNTGFVNVADFSSFPAGRTKADGEYSAQKFREEILLPALWKYAFVCVNLNGTLGYSSAWLQEAFQDVSESRLLFISNNENHVYCIREYIKNIKGVIKWQ